MINYIIIFIIILIIASSSFYIFKAKKNGQKCIGCPSSCNCDKKNKNGVNK